VSAMSAASVRSGAFAQNTTNTKAQFAAMNAQERIGAHGWAVSTSGGSLVRAQYRPLNLAVRESSWRPGYRRSICATT
jgi:hypothetical protein